MPNDLELFQGEGPAAQPTATAPMSGLTQRLARAWQHLRTMRSQARSAAARGADINAMQRIAPQLMEDVGIYDRAAAASIRRMENLAARGSGMPRHIFIARL